MSEPDLSPPRSDRPPRRLPADPSPKPRSAGAQDDGPRGQSSGADLDPESRLLYDQEVDPADGPPEPPPPATRPTPRVRVRAATAGTAARRNRTKRPGRSEGSSPPAGPPGLVGEAPTSGAPPEAAGPGDAATAGPEPGLVAASAAAVPDAAPALDDAAEGSDDAKGRSSPARESSTARARSTRSRSRDATVAAARAGDPDDPLDVEVAVWASTIDLALPGQASGKTGEAGVAAAAGASTGDGPSAPSATDDATGDTPAGDTPAGDTPDGTVTLHTSSADLDPADLGSAGLDPGGLDPAGLDPAGLDPGGLDPAGLDPVDPVDPGPEGTTADDASPRVDTPGDDPGGTAVAALAAAEPAAAEARSQLDEGAAAAAEGGTPDNDGDGHADEDDVWEQVEPAWLREGVPGPSAAIPTAALDDVPVGDRDPVSGEPTGTAAPDPATLPDPERTPVDPMDLAAADLTHANLTDVDLTGADLTGADLTDADPTAAERANEPVVTGATDEEVGTPAAPPAVDPPTGDGLVWKADLAVIGGEWDDGPAATATEPMAAPVGAAAMGTSEPTFHGALDPVPSGFATMTATPMVALAGASAGALAGPMTKPSGHLRSGRIKRRQARFMAMPPPPLGTLNARKLDRRAVNLNPRRIVKIEPGYGILRRIRSFVLLVLLVAIVAAAVGAVLALGVEALGAAMNHAISKSGS